MAADDRSQNRVQYVSDEEAARLLTSVFGVQGRLERLAGDRDQNYRVIVDDGPGWVFKVVDPEEPVANIELQNAVLDRIRERDPELAVQTVARTTDGAALGSHVVEGVTHPLRLLSYLPGHLLAGVRPRTPGLLRSLGETLGKLHRALDGFDSDAAHRTDWAWDPTRVHRVVRDGMAALPEDRRATVMSVADRFEADVLPYLADLPGGVIHGDANDHNLVVSAPSLGDRRVTGLLDFGDLLAGPWVADLGIAAAYACLGLADPVGAVAEVVRGYTEVRPLSEAEANVLFGFVAGRLAQSVTISGNKSPEERADPYVSISEAPAWEALERFVAEHPNLIRGRLRAAAGHAACPNSPVVAAWLRENRDRCGPLVRPPLDESHTLVFDMSPSSLDVPRLDRVLDVQAFDALLFGLMARAGAEVGIGRYDEPRLWYASDAFQGSGPDFPERRTVHTATDLFLPAGAPLLCPLDGTVHAFRDNDERLDYGPTIILEHKPDDGPVFWTLYGHLTRDSLEGLEIGQVVTRGTEFARIGPFPENGDWSPHVHFQLITDLLGYEATYPGVCLPSQREVWTSFSPDPALMIDLPEGTTYAAEPSDEAILTARDRLIGSNLSVSYGDEPLHIVRGWRQHLYTPDGQAWLDCVNNVCHVGHAHPRVVEAGQRQMAVLNTNTRYLHRNLVEYAERLAGTLPDPLEVCFFVNSGSEANELAIRMARTLTGRHDLAAIEVGYHGNTNAVVEASSYKFDGPGGRGAPEHVHLAPLPDLFRGCHPAAESDARTAAGRYVAEATKAIDRAEARGGVAAFLHESILSCGGQIELPEGYLEAVYTHARATGALCIADEVQVGFGRVGSHFWAFETQGVVPDIVTLGKPIGNGHPLGAVVTTRRVADAFANGMEFFSTFGGNPVSCAVGLAVLDVIEDERLQANAAEVGGRLKAGLQSLADAHPVVGDVRGRGLFLGIEFTKPDTREPLADVATYAVRRMKQKGVLLSTDGPDHNVIKIKPPLVFTASDADRVVEGLDAVLREDFVRSES